MIDCGADWLHRLGTVAPAAILITHAHLDHASGLPEGAPCPVYATTDTWGAISAYPIRSRQRVGLRRPKGLRIEVFPVVHSIRAPAVGFRISTRSCCFFYVPAVVVIPNRSKALGGTQLYIGDGATLVHPMVRSRAGNLIGHTRFGHRSAGAPKNTFRAQSLPIVERRSSKETGDPCMQP
jgi:phosphoribosyl 1,2-cyclic phosphodiesterase